VTLGVPVPSLKPAPYRSTPRMCFSNVRSASLSLNTPGGFFHGNES
jgi:hypothetical protein